jgi:hypothetical protein
VAGDGLAEVFDLEGALEAGGEEAAEGGDERGEGREDEDVELHGGDVEGEGVEGGEEGGEVVRVGDEYGVGGAGEAGEDGGAEVLRGVRRWRCWRGDGISWGGFGETGGKMRGRTLTGQMKYLYRIRMLVMPKPKMMVSIHAPTKPSTVFLGESLISWVRPKVMPHI